ncbi:MAG: DMT family transporter [candidate division Zixibacteria bacterium]|nr:DMT family transporter [candidate division Zixibacteria bacterium]
MVRQGTLYLTLFVATFAVSWAAIIIKFTDAGPIPNAFYRMALAAFILAIPSAAKTVRTWRGLNRRQRTLLLLSGFFLGLHFITWVSSLFYTTISNSIILVSTNPVFVMIMERLFFKQKAPVRSVIGMSTAIAGMIVIAGGDINLGREYIIGDILAVIGAVCVAIYLIIGRSLRSLVDNLSYTFPVYATAAGTILICGLFNGDNLTDYPSKTWLLFLLLALVPTLMGHSLYNWLLKFLPAHLVATTVLGEPIGATVLAIVFFQEIPGWATVIGGVMILSGIFVVMKRPKSRSPGRQ